MNKWYQDSHGNTSSKRIIGLIGFSVYLIIRLIILPVYSIYSGHDIGINAADGIDTAGMLCAGLLTAGVIEGFAKKKEVVK